jgi:hypothetical protein
MYYFAYGSNMDSKRIAERTKSYEVVEGVVLECYKLVFNKQSTDNPKIAFANIEKSENSRVEGILYNIDSFDILDKKESVPNNYIRLELKVCGKEKNYVAWTYIANPKKICNDCLPTKVYINYLLEGKDYLSEDYYYKIKNVVTRNEI